MKGLIPVSALCAAGAAVAIGMAPGDKMPQLAAGGDALSVAFGGAKTAISDAMLKKADSYFHGGVDMDCSCHDRNHHHDYDDHDEDGHDGNEHGEHSRDHGHDHGEHDHDHGEHSRDHEHDHGEHSHDHDEKACFDPWAWINERIRAPEVERHLEGEKAVELMPWFWASVKANSKNVEAWTTALYMAEHAIKNEKLAAEILADAKKANPRSIEIALAEGRLVYKGGRGDVTAAEAAFANARSLGLDIARGDLSSLSRKDGESFLNILDYLSVLASKRKDAVALAGFLDEARKIDAESVITKNISKRISALDSQKDFR